MTHKAVAFRTVFLVHMYFVLFRLLCWPDAMCRRRPFSGYVACGVKKKKHKDFIVSCSVRSPFLNTSNLCLVILTRIPVSIIPFPSGHHPSSLSYNTLSTIPVNLSTSPGLRYFAAGGHAVIAESMISHSRSRHGNSSSSGGSSWKRSID